MWVKEFQEPEGSSPNRSAGTTYKQSKVKTGEGHIQKETSIQEDLDRTPIVLTPKGILFYLQILIHLFKILS